MEYSTGGAGSGTAWVWPELLLCRISIGVRLPSAARVKSVTSALSIGWPTVTSNTLHCNVPSGPCCWVVPGVASIGISPIGLTCHLDKWPIVSYAAAVEMRLYEAKNVSPCRSAQGMYLLDTGKRWCNQRNGGEGESPVFRALYA